MNPVIVIGMVAVIGLSITVILSSISDQQELSEINLEVSENQQLQMQVSSGIAGVIDSDDMITIENSLNQDVSIIQIRVYDERGNFVESFPINQTISGNVSINLDELPAELRTMIGDESR